jgi:anti-sigma factor RsiW
MAQERVRVLAMVKRPMTCCELISLLSQYHDGELTARRRILADEHLAACEKCAGYLRGFALATVLAKESLEGLGEPPGELTFPEDLVQRTLVKVRGN